MIIIDDTPKNMNLANEYSAQALPYDCVEMVDRVGNVIEMLVNNNLVN